MKITKLMFRKKNTLTHKVENVWKAVWRLYDSFDIQKEKKKKKSFAGEMRLEVDDEVVWHQIRLHKAKNVILMYSLLIIMWF